MGVPFVKMHGLGNDFVVLDARENGFEITAAQAVAIADRRRGIGCDQVIVLEPASGADAFMRIRNPDGSEAGACGNATRCVAAWLGGQSGHRRVVLRTIAGDLPAELLADGQVTVDMGQPLLGWRDVPLAQEVDTLHLDMAADGVSDPAACSMGNPHATFFVADMEKLDIAAIGPLLEHHALFPERANIGFAQLCGGKLRLRVWERGAGLTLACGSGACAALVNANRRGLIGREATIILDGGELHIAWREDGHVVMSGGVATAFHGVVELAA